MHIAVTGASGRIGNVVVRQLLEAGHDVRVLQRSERRSLSGLPVERISGDLLDTNALDRLTKGTEVLIHLAALISVQGGMNGQVHRSNVEGTRNVLESALAQGVRRVICFSSVHAFQQSPKTLPLDETRPLAFQSRMAYDRSKAEAQSFALQFAAKHPIEVLALCPTSVLGSFDFEPSLSGQMLIDLYRKKVPMLVPGGFDWCDVCDVAAAAVAALDKGKSGEAYLLSGRYATLLQIAACASRVTGIPAPGHVAPDWLLRLGIPFVTLYSKWNGKRPLYTHEALDTVREGALEVSSQKAAEILGYTARPLEDSIAGAYQWFEQNKYL